MAKIDTAIDRSDCAEKAKASILPLPKKPINVTSVKAAKRLLSRIITGFQRGEIDGVKAKTMAYLLVTYVSICKDAEFEQRLSDLESKIGREL